MKKRSFVAAAVACAGTAATAPLELLELFGLPTLMFRPASSNPFIALIAAAACSACSYWMKQKPFDLPVKGSTDISTSLIGPNGSKAALMSPAPMS